MSCLFPSARFLRSTWALLLAAGLLCSVTGCPGLSPADDDDSSSGDDDDSSSDDDDDDSSGDDDDSFTTRLIHGVEGEDISLASGEAAVAPDGSLYVTWTERSEAGPELWVAHSSDSGASFGSPARVDLAGVAVTTFHQSRPRIAADNSRVAVFFTTLLGEDLWLSTSEAGSSLDFDEPTALAPAGPEERHAFQTLAFTPSGEIWLTWAQSRFLGGGEQLLRVFAARESENFEVEAITDESLGRPCTCCGMETLALSTGEVLVAYRGMDSPRNQFVVQHPGSAGGSWTSVQASTTNWEFEGCPENGPVLAELPGGGLRMAWSDASTGEARVWMVDSWDGGLSWDDQRLAVDPFEGAQTGGLLAVEPSGRTWIGWSFGPSGPEVASSDDGYVFGATTPLEVEGEVLRQPRLFAGSTGSFAVGIVDQAEFWLVSLP